MRDATILVGSRILARALERHLRFLFPREIRRIFSMRLGCPEDFLSNPIAAGAGVWIIEAFNQEDPLNPEGFRTAKQLADRAKILLLFSGDIEAIPPEGPLWVSPASLHKLPRVLEAVLRQPAPGSKVLFQLEMQWPKLSSGPERHHR